MDDPDERHAHQVGIVDVALDDVADLLDPLATKVELYRHSVHRRLRGPRDRRAGLLLVRLRLADSLQTGQRLAHLQRPHLDFCFTPINAQDFALFVKRQDPHTVADLDRRGVHLDLALTRLLPALGGAKRFLRLFQRPSDVGTVCLRGDSFTLPPDGSRRLSRIRQLLLDLRDRLLPR